ncbi:MAG: phospholipase D-like domain-containing protein [Burkholderiaceae bacterium]
MDAAARGVRVRLLIDSVGSLATPQRIIKQLRRGGVDVRRFMPLLLNPVRGRTNLRNHRKLAIADQQCLWSGGRNLCDEYFYPRPGHPAWIDMTFDVAGPIAQQATAQFEQDWNRTRQISTAPADSQMVDSPEGSDCLCQWIPCGPDQLEDSVHDLLMVAAYQARSQILAVTPHFVPNEALLNAWCTASRCGVRVHLVVPRQSNHRLADIARERALRQLVDAGGQVYLSSTTVHAKCIVIDDQIPLCGTVNLDGRSLFLNYEVMTAFYSQPEIARLSGWVNKLSDESEPYESRQPAWLKDLTEGVVRSVGFQL